MLGHSQGFHSQPYSAKPSLPTLQENVPEESTLMIPDTRQRLEAALQDLTNYVVSLAIWSSCSACELAAAHVL